jgi:hypothetical protein
LVEDAAAAQKEQQQSREALEAQRVKLDEEAEAAQA